MEKMVIDLKGEKIRLNVYKPRMFKFILNVMENIDPELRKKMVKEFNDGEKFIYGKIFGIRTKIAEFQTKREMKLFYKLMKE